MKERTAKLKQIIWVASTKEDLLSLPAYVKDEIGHALYQAQKGEKSNKAKPFKGFGKCISARNCGE